MKVSHAERIVSVAVGVNTDGRQEVRGFDIGINKGTITSAQRRVRQILAQAKDS